MRQLCPKFILETDKFVQRACWLPGKVFLKVMDPTSSGSHPLTTCDAHKLAGQPGHIFWKHFVLPVYSNLRIPVLFSCRSSHLIKKTCNCDWHTSESCQWPDRSKVISSLSDFWFCLKQEGLLLCVMAGLLSMLAWCTAQMSQLERIPPACKELWLGWNGTHKCKLANSLWEGGEKQLRLQCHMS